MNRAQRRNHARLWPVLAVAMAATIAASLGEKARVDHAVAGAATAAARQASAGAR